MRLQPKADKGFILAVTIILCTIILFILIFTGMTGVQIQLLDDVIYAERALDASYALENAAVAEMINNPHWNEGFDRTYFKDSMATAFMIFKQNHITPPLPYSYNNYGSKEKAKGWDGRSIPPGYVNLVIPSMSPDNSANWKINPHANRYLRQSMVHLYKEFFFEDFDKNGKGSTPRHKWALTCDPPLEPDKHSEDKVPPVHYKDSYCYLGQRPPYWHDVFMEVGNKDWENYEMEAIVAYYGYGSFGMYIHADDPQNGYGVLFAPRAGEPYIPKNYTLQGGSILFCYTKKIRTWTDYSPDQYWEPFDVKNSRISMNWYSNNDRHNPFMKEENKTHGKDRLYAMWKIKISTSKIKDKDNNEKQTMLVTMTPIEVSGSSGDIHLKDGESWTSREIEVPSDFGKKGRVGFYCEPNTMIAFTNVILRKQGDPMVAVPAQWHER